jgi:hypothetical protein
MRNENGNHLSIKILGLIIAALLIIMSLVYPVRADMGRSPYDGEWTITFTACNGNTRVYDHCEVTQLNEQWVTFTWAGRSREIKLPILSMCSTIIMERER